MNTVHRREREAQAMRERILDAALELFQEGGLAAVSMRKIAGRVDYSPAALYLYFSGKEAIVQGIRQRGFELLMAEKVALESVEPLAERLRQMCRGYLRFAEANPRLYELMFARLPEDTAPPEDAPGVVGFMRFARAAWEATPDAEARGLDPMAVGISLWAGLHGLAMILINNNLVFLRPEERHKYVDEALDMMLSARTPCP